MRKIYLTHFLLFATITTITSLVFLQKIKHHPENFELDLARSFDISLLIFLVDAIGLGLFLVAGFLLARSLVAPIIEITEVANAMRKGDYHQRVKAIASDELGILGITLNRLGDELTRRISTIAGEREQLRAMLASMVEGIVAVGSDDRVLFSNETAGDLLRGNLAGADGKLIAEVPHLSPLLPLIFAAREQKCSVARGLSLGNGEHEVYVEAKASPFKSGRDGGLVIVLHDVTELRRLENIRRDFVANVSHELKTPLTSIKGYVETISNEDMDEETRRRFLRKIDHNVGRLSELVQDILSLARVESADHGAMLYESVDLSALVEDIVREREDDLAPKSIVLKTFGCDAAHVVVGERNGLRQVVDNLLSNAIRYTKPSASIEIHLESRNSNEVVLTIKDSGIGIAKEHLSRIFERFYRVDKSRSRDDGGTGLGLSIVKHVVAAHQGRIQVDSELGKGSSFQVYLPKTFGALSRRESR